MTLLIGGFYSCKKSAECTCDNNPWGKETYSYSKLSKKEIEQTRTNCLAYGNCVWTELD